MADEQLRETVRAYVRQLVREGAQAQEGSVYKDFIRNVEYILSEWNDADNDLEMAERKFSNIEKLSRRMADDLRKQGAGQELKVAGEALGRLVKILRNAKGENDKAYDEFTKFRRKAAL